MLQLKEQLESILQEKNEKIIPENIRQGITIFGKTGILIPSDDTRTVKRFSSVEEMQKDPNPVADDLAIIYSKRIRNWTVNTESNNMIFPETVVLDEPISGYVTNVDFVPADGEGDIDINCYFAGTNFSLSSMGMSVYVHVDYVSEDGQTYTRRNNEIHGTLPDLKVKDTTKWDDNISKFIQTDIYCLDGIYKCRHLQDTTKYYICTNIHCETEYKDDDTPYIGVVYDTLDTYIPLETVEKITTLIREQTSHTNCLLEYIDDNTFKAYCGSYGSNMLVNTDYGTTENLPYICIERNGKNMYVYKITLDDEQVQLEKTITDLADVKDMNGNIGTYAPEEQVTVDRKFIISKDIQVELYDISSVINTDTYIRKHHPYKYEYFVTSQ